MAKQKVFTRANISEFLNTDRNYYRADGSRRVGLCEVSFLYRNAIPCGELLEIDIDGECCYRHEVNKPELMLNGITNALRVVNKFIEQQMNY